MRQNRNYRIYIEYYTQGYLRHERKDNSAVKKKEVPFRSPPPNNFVFAKSQNTVDPRFTGWRNNSHLTTPTRDNSHPRQLPPATTPTPGISDHVQEVFGNIQQMFAQPNWGNRLA
ncbi:hypothetical protein Ddc_08849 [Ditylenchus destructor]|nr:hypothetical protein Ddc_08849 [Ditylenchus destructor]